jgi:hypothetical protein
MIQASDAGLGEDEAHRTIGGDDRAHRTIGGDSLAEAKKSKTIRVVKKINSGENKNSEQRANGRDWICKNAS